MTQAELYQALKSLGMPVVYSHFDTDPDNPPPSPPYIAYLFIGNDDFIADNVNYKSIDNYQIELYTNKKDLASEKLVEDKLKELELPFTKLEAWIDSEELFQVLYQIQLV